MSDTPVWREQMVDGVPTPVDFHLVLPPFDGHANLILCDEVDGKKVDPYYIWVPATMLRTKGKRPYKRAGGHQ